MNAKSILSRQDYEEYLVRSCFGVQGGYLACCLLQAHAEATASVPGHSRLSNVETLRDQGLQIVQGALEDLCASPGSQVNASEFDEWHRALCQALVVLYLEHSSGQLSIGRAQKWVNGALKYIHVLSETRVPGYAHLYPYCHVPLDQAAIARLAPYGLPAWPVAWDRLSDYGLYLGTQQWIRRQFEFVPLDVDLLLELGQDLRNLSLP